MRKMGLALLAVLASGPFSSVADAPASLTFPVSQPALHRLQTIAVAHPCAALALFLILYDHNISDDNGFRLDFVPDPAEVASHFENMTDEGAAELSTLLRPNPYSPGIPRVYVHWFVTGAGTKRLAFRFRSELLDSRSGPIVPAHLIEPDADFILRTDDIWSVEDTGAALLDPHAT
jgi:hypothetical protein